MTHQELRIGNIVDYNDLFYQIAEIKFGKVKFVGDGRWIGTELLKGVVLTDEILHRFGWHKNGFDYTFQMDGESELILSSADAENYALMMQDGLYTMCIMTDIKYLHTLQNITYLILSGDIDTNSINVQNIKRRDLSQVQQKW